MHQCEHSRFTGQANTLSCCATETGAVGMHLRRRRAPLPGFSPDAARWPVGHGKHGRMSLYYTRDLPVKSMAEKPPGNGGGAWPHGALPCARHTHCRPACRGARPCTPPGTAAPAAVPGSAAAGFRAAGNAWATLPARFAPPAAQQCGSQRAACVHNAFGSRWFPRAGH